MSGYSSTTSIIFIAFGVLYGTGFLVAAWILVRKLLERQKKDEQNVVEGAVHPTGLVAPPIAAGASTPDQPNTKKDPSTKVVSEPVEQIDLGIDGSVDGGGF